MIEIHSKISKIECHKLTSSQLSKVYKKYLLLINRIYLKIKDK